jgi:glyoxylase-like metal-dependent hydrolase (beta-lactamase superfamily II)
VQLEQIRPRLWWWTAPHPGWSPDSFQEGRGWERDVSCYALVADDAFVLFDPLVPEGEEERFWEAVDRDVHGHGPPAVLLTVYWHARSAGAVLERYEGASVWVHLRSREQFAERVRITNEFADGDVLPGGVEAIALHQAAEAAFWLPTHRALVLGDSVLGYEGRAELSPESWLDEGQSQTESEAAVRRALEREPELLLLTHGGPRPAAQLQL